MSSDVSPASDDPPEQCTILFRPLPTASRLSPPEKSAVKAFAGRLVQRLADGRAFTCLVTDDRELRTLNRAFLKHDYPTDVLSFPASDDQASLGEIAISADRAQAQAAYFGHARIDELRVLMLHGVLHLTGLDHTRDRGAMARAERKWRHILNLPPTLIGRASQSSKGSKR